jgi:hypothetical protein
MKIEELRELLKNKEVIEEINRHLWIESQKAGYSIGIERATDEWLTLYAEGWMRYHMPEKLKMMQSKSKLETKKIVKKDPIKIRK